jgi:uncharacterized membrane protein YqjE
MSETGTKPGGMLASLRRMGDSFLALAQSRLQLFALELQSEKLRLMDALLWLSIAVALGAMGLIVGTVALAIYLWEMARYVGLALVSGLFVGAAVVIVWRLREGIRKGPMPLAGTIAEFKKDRACLQGKG